MIETYCGKKRFEYWTDAVLTDFVDENELIEAYNNQEGEHHYFDSDTMTFFGTEDFHMVAPGISVEYQSGAPDGVSRWSVVSWVFSDEDNDNFTPYSLCRHDSLSDAAICGHISYQSLNPKWNAMEEEGFCSDHGESLQEGCSQCDDEHPHEYSGCFIHGYAYDKDCRQCDRI
jgi:hypothetical protein